MNRNNRIYTPSEQQIKEECEKIRQSWSEYELHKRNQYKTVKQWYPPIVSTDSIPSSELSMLTEQ